ncbi:DUF58 domain-containing protein [Actinorugispora endophytica]|uniref:Uncharacterized protein (DUF58 family) n=1 Tax=Actinorugispora endophytica TaxID=1605990 RepID=A0A4R6UYK0_9ACTN|nr:DUF58 domain-containing protein [Actinorugispora endophytica]TDQ52590.1 uncharacterized protein (DUF58 family) [Actinorugispora endophytica]
MNVLRSFTLRGRVFLCVGVALAVGALLVGERDLLRIAVLVTVLPPVCALMAARAPGRVEHTRELTPARVPVGGDCRVVLTLANTSRTRPTGTVLVEDRLPYALGAPPRFTIGRLRPGERRTVSYRLRSHMRGRYPVGPLTLYFTDPLGCARFADEVGTGVSLLVTPSVVALPEAPGHGGSTEAGQSRARVAASLGDDDAVPREYRHGDGLRRVHWRSTARRGRLMVRREEQRWRDHSTVLLDTRSGAHAGGGPASSLEGAVTMAASVAVHLLDRNHELRFVAGTELGPLHRRDEVLDALAVVRPSASASLRAGIGLLARAPVNGRGVLVAVVGALGVDEVDALAACRPGPSGGRVAVLAPGAAWPSPEARDAAAGRLADAGWRVLAPDHPGALPGLWGGATADAR